MLSKQLQVSAENFIPILSVTTTIARSLGLHYNNYATVLPAKNDGDVMLCLPRYQGLESIDHLCINPIHRIGLIHK